MLSTLSIRLSSNYRKYKKQSKSENNYYNTARALVLSNHEQKS